MVRVAVADEKLYCRDERDGLGWAIRVADIVLIAEYTTSDGPNADDYFLLFLTRENDELFYSSVTMAAYGMNAALEALEQQMKVRLNLALEECREPASCVLWPKSMAGTPYFEYDPVEPTGMWEQVRAHFKRKPMKERVADRVLKFLESLSDQI